MNIMNLFLECECILILNLDSHAAFYILDFSLVSVLDISSALGGNRH